MLANISSWISLSGLLPTVVILLVAVPLIYIGLSLMERRFTKAFADRFSDLLLIVPLVLGVLAGLNELSAFREDRAQLQDTLRCAELDNSISIAMAGLSDIATEQNALCRAKQDFVLIRSMANELNKIHARLQHTGLEFAAIPRAKCDPLTNLARNTLIWSAAPGHAAEFRDYCDVLRTTVFVDEDEFLFETMVRRGQTANIMPRLRSLSDNLLERRVATELGGSGVFQVIAL